MGGQVFVEDGHEDLQCLGEGVVGSLQLLDDALAVLQAFVCCVELVSEGHTRS